MAFSIDLHIHTVESGDSDADPEEVVARAIERGLHGIVFTEHSSYEASDYAEALKEKYSSRLLILRGVEFSAAEGHVLVYGVNTDRLSLWGAPARELISAVTKEGGVVIPSHPFRVTSCIGGILHSLSGITALEGYNGCNLHAMNVAALEAARELGLPVTGGSDAHSPSEVGKCHTVFEEHVTEDNFLDRLREGRYHGVDLRKISKRLWMPGSSASKVDKG